MPEPEMAMTDALHGSETVQNTRAACRDCEELCSECEEQLQRQTEDQFRDRPESCRMSSVPPLEANIRSIQGGGEPLTASQRDFFEPRFGMDFSAVRLHTGSGAGELARSLEARAFTFGSEIVFGESEYDPGSSSAGARINPRPTGLQNPARSCGASLIRRQAAQRPHRQSHR
jgi:Domain of unknown function (DUF4157)